MGKFYETIPEHIAPWILQQQMLWVSTAPLSAKGHINVSPKGGQYFGLLDNKTFWYMDLSGSGCETISHLRENGRIVVMFNAFQGAPKIIRLWGYGRVIERETAAFDDFVSKHSVEVIPASRSIIVVDVHQVGSSCGYSVPFYEFKEYRQTLNQLFEKKLKDVESGKRPNETNDRYWAYKDAWSNDGLPGMQRGIEVGAREQIKPLTKMVGPHAPVAPHGPASYKLGNQVRYHIATFRFARVQLASALLMALMAFVFGMLVVAYGPALLKSQQVKLERVLF